MARKKNGHSADSEPENEPGNDPEDDREDDESEIETKELAKNGDGNGEQRGPTGMFRSGQGGPGRGRSLPGKMTRSAAMKRLGCTKGRLDALVSQNKLEAPEKDADGRWWYSIESVEDLVEDTTEESTTEQQIVLAASKIIESQGQATNRLIEQQMEHNDELAKTMVKMIEETGKREAALMGAFLGATQKILEVQTEWSAKSMQRTSAVEEQLDQAHDTIQKAMDLNASREVQMAEAASRQRRNDAIGRGLEAHIPTVLSLVAQKFGVPADVATDPLVKDLMNSVTEEQAIKLYQSGILTQAQMGQLMGIWESMRKEKMKTEEPPKEEPKTEASSPAPSA